MATLTTEAQPEEMVAAAAPAPRHDHVESWPEELDRLLETVASLPAAARAAVLDVLDAFVREEADPYGLAARTRSYLLSLAPPAPPARSTGSS
jgi:hypothetical protein